MAGMTGAALGSVAGGAGWKPGMWAGTASMLPVLAHELAASHYGGKALSASRGGPWYSRAGNYASTYMGIPSYLAATATPYLSYRIGKAYRRRVARLDAERKKSKANTMTTKIGAIDPNHIPPPDDVFRMFDENMARMRERTHASIEEAVARLRQHAQPTVAEHLGHGLGRAGASGLLTGALGAGIGAMHSGSEGARRGLYIGAGAGVGSGLGRGIGGAIGRTFGGNIGGFGSTGVGANLGDIIGTGIGGTAGYIMGKPKKKQEKEARLKYAHPLAAAVPLLATAARTAGPALLQGAATTAGSMLAGAGLNKLMKPKEAPVEPPVAEPANAELPKLASVKRAVNWALVGESALQGGAHVAGAFATQKAIETAANVAARKKNRQAPMPPQAPVADLASQSDMSKFAENDLVPFKPKVQTTLNPLTSSAGKPPVIDVPWSVKSGPTVTPPTPSSGTGGINYKALLALGGGLGAGLGVGMAGGSMLHSAAKALPSMHQKGLDLAGIHIPRDVAQMNRAQEADFLRRQQNQELDRRQALLEKLRSPSLSGLM